MKKKLQGNLILIVLLMSFFCAVGEHSIYDQAKLSRLTEKTITSSGFRQMELNDDMITILRERRDGENDMGKTAGLYLLESKFSYDGKGKAVRKETVASLAEKWKKRDSFPGYLKECNAIWNDVQYFPVPLSSTDSSITVSYADSWMTERTYGGKRGHEGTDIMASENVPGLYPVVSMTDGVIRQKGWLEKGGYRLLIEAPLGGCFYYAHLDSYADVKQGDEVRAGQVIGFMGNTGYGKKEGTKGKFDVHLHLGIYLYPGGEETSINPYWVLKYIEDTRVKCAYS